MKHISFSYKVFALLIALSAIFIAFFHIGAFPIYQWDESRNGSIAIEMMRSGDYINYYYLGNPDLWVAKPPLNIYLIAISFKLFGLNEFAFRLPSALASLGTVFFTALIVLRFSSAKNGMLVSMMLIVVEGLFGMHVGRTADFDSLFAFTILGGAYFFLRAVTEKSRPQYLMSALFFTLAFYTKGLAVFIFLPAIFLFFCLDKNIRKQWKMFLASGMFILISVAAWFILISVYGKKVESSPYFGDNASETMILYDTWSRFTGFNFPGKPESGILFLPAYLDAKFSIYYFLFYAAILAWILKFFFIYIKKDNSKKTSVYLPEFSGDPEKILLKFSFFFWVVPSIILTVSRHKFGWYLAPSLPFIAIFTVLSLDALRAVRTYIPFAIITVFLILAGIKIHKYSNPNEYPGFLTNNEKQIKECPRILLPGDARNDYYLWMLFRNQNIYILDPRENFCAETVDFIPEMGAKCTCLVTHP